VLTISFAGVVSLVSVNWMDLTMARWDPRRAALAVALPAASVRCGAAPPWSDRGGDAYVVCRPAHPRRARAALVALRENETPRHRSASTARTTSWWPP